MTIRITCLLKRHPDMTQEQFERYWTEIHGPLFASLQWCKVHLIRYNQFHTVRAHSDTLAKAGLHMAPYDGAAELEVEKMEDILALMGDEQHKKSVIPDDLKFLDRAAVTIMVGEDQVKYQRV